MATNINLKMIDCDTGEILGSTSKSYVLDFGVSSDAGFKFLKRWYESALRGIRKTEHKSIEVRVHFQEDVKLPSLFAPKDY